MPFYLRTGKRLARRVTEIALGFKRAPHLPFTATDTEELGYNALVLRIQPDEGVTLRFGAKVPGTQMEIREVNMDFAYGGSFTESSPEAYERLILDVLLGDPPLFPQHEEVELSWQILDPILDYWAEPGTPPEDYEPGGWGPSLRHRDARPRRPRLEAAMKEDQRERSEHRPWASSDDHRPADTTTAKISSALLRARRNAGSPAMGMVLTLLVVCEEKEYESALKARMEAGREHPARILLIVTASGRTASLDAELRIGEGTPGEVVVMRMRGPVAAHPASVVRPLLLPDSPVVIWWPGKAPAQGGQRRARFAVGPSGHRRSRREAAAWPSSRPGPRATSPATPICPGRD